MRATLCASLRSRLGLPAPHGRSAAGATAAKLRDHTTSMASRASDRALNGIAATATAARLAAAAGGEPQLSTTVWEVGGLPTEVLDLPAAGPARVQLLIIPGNPGAAPYYTPFMRALHLRLGGQAAVTCVSNLGMDGQGLTPRGRVFSLEEQIQHKVNLLRERFAGPGRPPLVVLAHSIGCYMSIHAVFRLENSHLGSSRAATAAVDAVARRQWEQPGAAPSAVEEAGVPAAAGAAAAWEDQEEAAMESMREELVAVRQRQQGQAGAAGAPGAGSSGGQASGGGAGSGDGSSSSSSEAGRSTEGPASNVVKVVGLYPFLTVDPDCRHQRRLAQLTRYHSALARLAGGVGALPLGLRRALVRLVAPQLEPHAVDTTVQVFTSATSAENGLYMGLTEFETLAAPADWWLLEALGPRLAVFVAPGDTWFKKWKWDLLHKKVPGVESYWVDTQTHAFCVSQAQSDELAGNIAPLVEAALQPRPQAVSRL